MELRHLRYFIAIAEEENFHRAAQRLFMSQSPLSRQMRDLQNEMGVELLEPDGRGVRLTAAGRYFADRARSIVASAEAAVDGARQVAAGQIGTVTIGFETGTAYWGQLAGIVGTARRREPRITIQLTPMTGAEQWEALRAGEIALGYGFHPADDPTLTSAIIARDRLGAVLAHDHPLAARDALRVEDFHGQVVLLQPWILYPRLHDDLFAMVRARGVHPDIRTHITDLEAIITLVAAGDGLTFLPENHTANLALGSAVWRPVAGLHHETLEVVLWRTADADSPLLRPLLNVVRDMTPARPHVSDGSGDADACVQPRPGLVEHVGDAVLGAE
ncbi:LysR substrate-binding domain-containing protein [Acrocarpospora sp. B8E8]|uniref:LysR substrate-binding domain-containing protein n=1 Tax=Acrocarpospora sp. B8E8 TaxID=3153572 RepID=UPI00325DDE70